MSLRSWIFECGHKVGFSEPHSWTQNWQKSHFFQVVGTFGSWGRDIIADCYIRWNPCPSCWTIDKTAICGMVPSSISEEEQSHQEGRSWSLYSGTVKERFLWMWCQEGGTVSWCSRMPTDLGSVSNEFSHTRIQSYSSVAIHGCREVWRLRNP
jgi:hypothetical protein